MVQAIFQWLNNDSTADLNLRFAAVFNRGITKGGELVPVSGQSKVSITPYYALSNDGLLMVEEDTVTMDVPLNQASIIALRAKWIQAGDAVAEYAVIELTEFQSLVDKDDYIVFGSVIMNSGDSVVTTANIELSFRDVFDRLGRSSFRGWISSSTDIPSTDNRPGDFWIVNQGTGDLAEIYAWNGTSLLNITNTLALQNQLSTHRNNGYANEIHLTNEQADAAMGSTGIPAGDNRYVTEQDPRLPTQAENDAIAGSNGTPSATNRMVTEEYPLAQNISVLYTLPPGILTLINVGEVFIGKQGIGTANGYFTLMDVNKDRGYINTSGINPKINGIYKNALLTSPLNPNTDADNDGFYSGDLYVTVDAVIDTGVRLSFAAKNTLKTISKGFDAIKGPASDFVSGDTMMHIQNIKGRPYDELIPSDESTKNLRLDVDNLISYLGSNQTTSIVAGDEDYDYFATDSKLSPYFVRNLGFTKTKTFNNTGLIGFTYAHGVVTFNSAVNLTSVNIGDLFRDGNSNFFKITGKTTNTLNIVNIDNGIIPADGEASVSTSVAHPEDGAVYLNNNPRDILVSELKVNSHEIIKFNNLYRLREFSKPEGRTAFGVSQSDKRINPRVVLYGSWEQEAEPATGEVVIKNTTSIGDFAYTGFFSHLFLLVKAKPGSPNLDVSINSQPVAYSVSTSFSGAVEPTVASITGQRYHKIPLVTNNDPSVLTHINAKIQGASTDPLYILGTEIVTVADNRNNKLVYSEQFDQAAWALSASLIQANVIASPDGTNVADKIVETAATAVHQINQAYSFLNNTYYTLSVFAKAAERNVLAFNIADSITGTQSHAVFDLLNGLAQTHASYTGGSASIDPYPNGWFRCSWTFLTIGAGSSSVQLQLKSAYNTVADESYLGNGTSGLYLYGAQLELGQVATTYVPTGASNINTSVSSQGYSVEAGIGFSNTRMLRKLAPEVITVNPLTTTGGVSYELGLSNGNFGPFIKQVNDPIDRPTSITGNPGSSPNNTINFSAAPPPLFGTDALVEVKVGSTVRKITRITGTSGNQVTLADNVGSISPATLTYLGMFGNSAPSESTESPYIARYLIVEEFKNYTTTDFSSKNAAQTTTRYAVGTDGTTILSANNATVNIDTQAVKIPQTTGLLNIGALATRIEVEFDNAFPVTIQVSVNGSSFYDMSVPAGVNKRTIISNATYTWHEVQIKSSSANFFVTHLLLSGPTKIHVSPDPKLAVIDYIAPYVAPSTNNTYSIGKCYYDILQNAVPTKGAGAFPTWSWSDTPVGLLRVLNTTNEGDKLTFYIVGSGFEMSYLARPDGGAARVLIDGVAWGSIAGTTVVKEFASTTHLDTYIAGGADRRLCSIRGLPFGVHKVELTVERAAKNLSSSGFNFGIFGYSVISNMDVKRTYADGFFNYVADAREYSSFYADLIGEPAFAIETTTGIKSAYGRFDGTAPSYNMNLSTVNGKTRIELTWTFVYNANPGTAFGELYIHIDGKLVPRFTAGYTGQSWYTEVSSNIIELDDDYSGTDFEVFIVKIAGPTNIDVPVSNPWLGQKVSATIAAGASSVVAIDPIITDPTYMVVAVKYRDVSGKLVPFLNYVVDDVAKTVTVTNNLATSQVFYVSLKG